MIENKYLRYYIMPESTIVPESTAPDINNIYSAIFGALIAIILWITLKPTTVYRGPNSNDIRKKIYHLNGKCYRLKPVVTICPKTT